MYDLKSMDFGELQELLSSWGEPGFRVKQLWLWLLKGVDDFAEMNAEYAKFFEGTAPARSAVAVKTLPKNARLEIEAIAVK